jgi:hypothetical protein
LLRGSQVPSSFSACTHSCFLSPLQRVTDRTAESSQSGHILKGRAIS